ncbi:MAG: hypothetical protein M3N50_01595 [Pseudomonadota bacterium]|nr:hypothetical protein [Pseudomonadota bacterium]
MEPPINAEAEAAVLGAILANNRAMDLCIGLEAHHFAYTANQEIFRACQRRISLGRKVDAVTLKGVFENSQLFVGQEHGASGYLAHLLASLVGIDTAGDYARAVIDCYQRRRLIKIAQEINDRAYYATNPQDEMDASAIGAWAQSELDDVAADASTRQGVGLAAAVERAVSQSEAAQRGERTAIGLMTGIASLDEMWGGLHAGSLDILGARSKTGKTSFALQIARHVASEGAFVGIISLEMPARDVGLFNLASLSGVGADNIRRGRYNTDQAGRILQAQRELAILPIEICDQPRLTLADGVSFLRGLKRKRNLRLAIVDHRNLFGRDAGVERTPRLDWYGEVTQRLKNTAKMLNIAVLLLVQINRGVESRDDPRPRVADLEYGGEQDADNVVLLYRPELHFAAVPPKRFNETEEHYANALARQYEERQKLRGTGEVILAKRRFGPEGICHLNFVGHTMTWVDPAADQPELI